MIRGRRLAAACPWGCCQERGDVGAALAGLPAAVAVLLRAGALRPGDVPR